MKFAAKLLYGLTVFLEFMVIVYIFGTRCLQDTGNTIDESQDRLEWTSATGLISATLMTLILGGYFHFTERCSGITPSDFEEVEIVDGTDTLSFSFTSSIWPLVITIDIPLVDYGIASMVYWSVAPGAVIPIVVGAKLNTQYITPPEKHQSECN